MADTSSGALNMDNATMGYSTTGATQYLEQIKINILDDMAKLLREDNYLLRDIKAEFDRGWVGHSREVFDQQFQQARESIADDLQKEYNDLESRVKELVQNFIDQDLKMME